MEILSESSLNSPKAITVLVSIMRVIPIGARLTWNGEVVTMHSKYSLFSIHHVFNKTIPNRRTEKIYPV